MFFIFCTPRVTISLVTARKKTVDKFGRGVAQVLNSLYKQSGLSYRALSEKSSLSLNRVGIILRAEFRAIDVDELFRLCEALNTHPSFVIAAAEWLVYGEAPEGLSEDDVRTVESLLPGGTCVSVGEKCAPIPLFSDRDGDEFPAEVALPRMA